MNNMNNYNVENNLVGNNELGSQGTINSVQMQNQPVCEQDIVAIQWDDQERRILAVKLEDGSVHYMDEAIRLAEEGKIKNVVIGHSAYGDPYLRGVGDGDKSNNLRNLPEF